MTSEARDRDWILLPDGRAPSGSPDFDANRSVSTSDVLALFANWGACA